MEPNFKYCKEKVTLYKNRDIPHFILWYLMGSFGDFKWINSNPKNDLGHDYQVNLIKLGQLGILNREWLRIVNKGGTEGYILRFLIWTILEMKLRWGNANNYVTGANYEKYLEGY